MKYNYVFFDSGSTRFLHNNKADYFYICTQDLRKNGIKVVSYPMAHLPFVFHLLFAFLTRINRKFEKLFYRKYFKNDFNNNKPFCFLIYGYYITPSYIEYLKTNYPNSKIIKIHRDLVSLWKKRNPLFINDLSTYFDYSFTYDKDEAAKYNMVYFDEFESKLDYLKPFKIKHDVFFAGYAKNRLDILLKIASYFEKHGINYYFYIVSSEKINSVGLKGIRFSKKPMSYLKMLKESMSSNVLLEINQLNAVGYTSRFLESVMYNKKLMTNNQTILKTKYYNAGYIKVFETIDDFDLSFIKAKSNVDYNYSDDFSPMHLIDKIEKILNNNDK